MVCFIGGNASGVAKVLLLQKTVVRIITFSIFWEHSRPLFVKERILTVINQDILDCLGQFRL